MGLTLVSPAVVAEAVELECEEAVEEVVGDQRDHQLVERRPRPTGLSGWVEIRASLNLDVCLAKDCYC